MADAQRFAVIFDSAAETSRTTRAFASWTGCALAAVLGASLWHAHRLAIAVVVGLLVPLAWSLLRKRRFARGGGWSRGIQLELDDVELRLWGRGYGTRVPLAGARLRRRYVICYLGRRGFYRQSRLVLEGTKATLEVAAQTTPEERERETFAATEDQAVELARGDFDRLARELESRLARVEPAVT